MRSLLRRGIRCRVALAMVSPSSPRITKVGSVVTADAAGSTYGSFMGAPGDSNVVSLQSSQRTISILGEAGEASSGEAIRAIYKRCTFSRMP